MAPPPSVLKSKIVPTATFEPRCALGLVIAGAPGHLVVDKTVHSPTWLAWSGLPLSLSFSLVHLASGVLS